MTDADAYVDTALEILNNMRFTPDELREWFMAEVGTQKQPGRASMVYSLKPIHKYRIEQVCRRKVQEYDAWSNMIDRAFAEDLEPITDERRPSPDSERAA